VDELLLSTFECPTGGGTRQTEIQIAEQFVPERSISECEVAIGKLKSYKSPGAEVACAYFTQLPNKQIGSGERCVTLNARLSAQKISLIVRKYNNNLMKISIIMSSNRTRLKHME
jgi:hypothetical protein